MGIFGIEGILSEIFCCLLFETGPLSVVDEKTQAIFTKFDFFDNGNSCGFIPPEGGEWVLDSRAEEGFVQSSR